MAQADTAPALERRSVAEAKAAPARAFWRRLPRPLPRSARPSPPVLAPQAAPFQDELEALLQEPPPPLLRALHWMVAGLFAGLLAVAALAQLDVVVTGHGRLAPDAQPIVLQPLERTVIREIRVKPGERVTQGQVLAVLDPSFAEADRAALTSQRRSLSAHLQRLQAELAGDLVQAPLAADPESLLQAELQARRQSFVASRLGALDEEMRGIEATLRGLTEADAALAEQIAVSRDIEAVRERLLEGQLGSRLNLLTARHQRLQAEREREQGRGRLQELRHALETKRAERQGFLDDWRRQLLEETVRVRGELARVEEALGKATRLAELTQLVAPADGIVLEVARRSVGSVLREAEPLVSLVPEGAPLIAEIALRSADIGYVRPGDAVIVKVHAFPFQRHGALHGTLRAIAQDSSPGEQAPEMAGMHRAQVVLEAPSLIGLPQGTAPTPGMTVQAEVRVGTRSLLSYLVFPLLRGLSEGMREP